MADILLSSIPLDDLKNIFREILREEMASNKVDEILLSNKEACKVFQPAISRVTLASWVKRGLIPSYVIGGRTYFKRSEIIKAAKELKRYDRKKISQITVSGNGIEIN